MSAAYVFTITEKQDTDRGSEPLLANEKTRFSAKFFTVFLCQLQLSSFTAERANCALGITAQVEFSEF